MAHFESARGEIVLHVVYDGPPTAGKTTNVHALHENLLSGRAGGVESPGSTGRRTEFFDFREFRCGMLHGHPLLCRLISVPGQPDRAIRRRFLIEHADVVVFVVDPDTSRLGEHRAMIRSLSKLLATADIPLIVQLNKMDLAGDLTPELLLEELRLDPSTPCIGAVAKDGIAVSQTFLLAAKHATERARRQLEDGTIKRDQGPKSAPEWVEALLEHERRLLR